MIETVIEATDAESWRETLAAFSKVDVCQMPEYHITYGARVPNSRPLLWSVRDDDFQFSYPFLLTPVTLERADGAVEFTDYWDISSIYGYSGPLCTSLTDRRRDAAWASFDDWATERRIIAEFTRFSAYVGNEILAHPNAAVERNRPIAIMRLDGDDEATFAALSSKTRNMIRKAGRSGLESRELDASDGVAEFRALYVETMERNDAPGFFRYDDRYYRDLLAAPPGAVRLFGVFDGKLMVAAAMALVHEKCALYHLGASRLEYTKLGAGNLSMFAMARGLGRGRVRFLNLGGGRTTAEDDALFRFKRSNGTDVTDFFIGKRVLSATDYESIRQRWSAINQSDISSSQLIFYR